MVPYLWEWVNGAKAALALSRCLRSRLTHRAQRRARTVRATRTHRLYFFADGVPPRPPAFCCSETPVRGASGLPEASPRRAPRYGDRSLLDASRRNHEVPIRNISVV